MKKNIQEARERDLSQINSSKYRTHHTFQIGDGVFTRNFNKTHKFYFLFLPEPFEIIGINTKENKSWSLLGKGIRLCVYILMTKNYSGNCEYSKNQTSIQEGQSESKEPDEDQWPATENLDYDEDSYVFETVEEDNRPVS